MPHAKSAAAVGLVVALLVGCGSTVKPSQGRGKVDDPRTYSASNYLGCLTAHRLPVQMFGPAGLQIGAPPSGPTIIFKPTPSAAQAAQIEGAPQYQGAEVIGAALLYPHQAPEGELAVIEGCLSSGVTA